MKLSKRKQIALISILVSFIILLLILNADYSGRYFSITEPDHPHEFKEATIYGTLQLTEKIDASRSGMVIHDLNIEVDRYQSESSLKTATKKPFDPSSYKSLSWESLKNNILFDGENYVGLDNISEKFKTTVLKTKIKIDGRIYKHCIDISYLSPSDEIPPKESFTCWAAPIQHHIRLSGLYK